jgi:hypothetical protein
MAERFSERDWERDWEAEDEYWRRNYETRPYASSGTFDYDYYRPGYRYGYEAAHRYSDHQWDDVESDLRRDWDVYEHRGKSTWEQMKSAIRDAWDRVTGNRPAGARR